MTALAEKAGQYARAIAALLPAVFVLAAPGPALAASSGCDDVTLTMRVVSVRYKPLTEASLLVDQLLSPCGSYKVPKALGKIIVEDAHSVLDEIEVAIASWDLPPRLVEVTVSLVRGKRDAGRTGGKKVEELRDLTDTLDSYVRFSTWEPLGSATVRVREGGESLLDLGEGYQAAFRIGAVDGDRGVIQVEPFTLQKIPPPGGVSASPSIPLPILRNMVLDLPDDQRRIIGAYGREPTKALFLMIKATVLDEDGAGALEQRLEQALRQEDR